MNNFRSSAIIVGAPRSGTTSLWRYLSHHSEIAQSKIKELNYFYEKDAFDKKDYDKYFATSGSVTLEASPVYFREHAIVAEKIASSLPNAQLIFILREPASRLVASFNREKYWFYRVAEDISFLDYAKIIVNDLDPTSIFPEDFAQAKYVCNGSKVGFYADILKHYLDYFPAKQILILFLDELIHSPNSVIARCCQHIGVGFDEFPNIKVKAENKGVKIKNKTLFSFANKANLMFEPIFNKTPWFRSILRDFHHEVNASAFDYTNGEVVEGRAMIEKWYEEHNVKFAELMASQFPDAYVPDWLTKEQKRDL